jgi:hypothetical protein
MIFVILSAITLIAVIAILHLENSRLKSFFLAETNNICNIVKYELGELKKELEKSTKAHTPDNLENEILALKQEKENESKLRIEAEKQADSAFIRLEEIEKRMNDWKLLQDGILKSAKDEMAKIAKEITKEFGGFTKNNSSASQAKPSSNLVASLIEAMNKNKFVEGKNYFLPSTFKDQPKSMLCELAFIDENQLYILDFKSHSYFSEYSATTDKKAALEVLKQRLDKYFNYLGNQKYYDSISNLLLKTYPSLENGYVIMVAPNQNDVELIKKLNYDKKASNMAIDIAFLDEIKNLVL